MSARPWYKRYAVDFIHGTMGLTLEEKGAYSILLDLIYDRGGPIPDDARYISGVCGCSLRKWSAIRDRLVSAGKITLSEGRISNVRAEKEIEIATKSAQERAESGSKGGRNRAENRSAYSENNDIAEAKLKHTRAFQKSETEEEEKKDIAPNGARGTAAQGEVKEAFDCWNLVAAEHGLSRAEKLTDARKRSIRQRIADAGGLEGWKAALDRIGSSSFLTGRKTGFRADLDFILQAKSFTKLIEGAYDDVKPKGTPLFGITAAKVQDAPHGRDERGVPLTDRGYPVDRDPWAFVH